MDQRCDMFANRAREVEIDEDEAAERAEAARFAPYRALAEYLGADFLPDFVREPDGACVGIDLPASLPAIEVARGMARYRIPQFRLALTRPGCVIYWPEVSRVS